MRYFINITPRYVVRPVLYKDVVYTEHSSEIHPPFGPRISICRYRTLSSHGRKICIPPVHGFIRSPAGYVSIWFQLPCWSFQRQVFCYLNLQKKTHSNYMQYVAVQYYRNIQSVKMDWFILLFVQFRRLNCFKESDCFYIRNPK